MIAPYCMYYVWAMIRVERSNFSAQSLLRRVFFLLIGELKMSDGSILV